MEFSNEQISKLDATLSPENVSTRTQSGTTLSFIEAHHAIREANRIFGYGGWVRETVYCKEVCRVEYVNRYKDDKKMLRVGYEAKVCVEAGGVRREGTGHGQATVGNEDKDKLLFEAIEGAAKEAETDAMKRALMTFGDQFGLALYDKQKKHVAPPEPDDGWVDKGEVTEKLSGFRDNEALKDYWVSIYHRIRPEDMAAIEGTKNTMKGLITNDKV